MTTDLYRVKSGDGYLVRFEGLTPLMTTHRIEAAHKSIEQAEFLALKLKTLGYVSEIVPVKRGDE